MTYQINYKREDGYDFVQEVYSKKAADDFVKILTNAGIYCETKVIDDRVFQLCEVAFSLDDVVDIKAGKKKPYTFADPDKHGSRNGVVMVELEDGRQKPSYVVSVACKTVTEIKEIANGLGRKKLCKVIKKIA